ncbi:hypothetical protein DRO69_12350 [Candidatus Bathyarchaeota archaeon]|nr:MAG: hypothetical protein DRO69_12350 [Candidatus Bathyarchaeota archaeon]
MRTSGKIGKAGELLVANELLREGLDVFIPLVDTGIDIICLVDHKPILIQVKESRLYPDGRYWQRIRKDALLKNKADNMFYVFVLKAENYVNYLVLPSTFLYDNLEKLDVDKKGMIDLYFVIKNGHVKETRKSNLDLTEFLNNFKLLTEVRK